ncbi:hypothetical protein NDU88_001000 [Pleurodeles waltl]|uniref:Uncharacterized protein n=1 Tax=Pleurodeles waltl TaxID=8319 RepID=A0AAV7SBA2_PLEWA|nr:hypothetical protein NDU88_001000 [Pleurodeles waltl]
MGHAVRTYTVYNTDRTRRFPLMKTWQKNSTWPDTIEQKGRDEILRMPESLKDGEMRGSSHTTPDKCYWKPPISKQIHRDKRLPVV